MPGRFTTTIASPSGKPDPAEAGTRHVANMLRTEATQPHGQHTAYRDPI